MEYEWAIVGALMVILFKLGQLIERKKRSNSVDGIIFWNEHGVNMKLAISIRELALERDFVVLQVIPNKEVRDDIREMSDDSNRTIEGGQ